MKYIKFWTSVCPHPQQQTFTAGLYFSGVLQKLLSKHKKPNADSTSLAVLQICSLFLNVGKFFFLELLLTYMIF